MIFNAENGKCSLSRLCSLVEVQIVTTLPEIGLYYVSRTVKFFIADSLVHKEHSFKGGRGGAD